MNSFQDAFMFGIQDLVRLQVHSSLIMFADSCVSFGAKETLNFS